MEVITILAIVICILAVISLIPQAQSWPLLSVSMLLTGIALLLFGRT